jgi:transglutaminase-like putative cysteine protease
MSTDTAGALGRAGAWARPDLRLTRLLALAGLVALLASFLAVLHRIVVVSGDPSTFLFVVAVTLVAATGLARVLRVPVALSLATLLLGVGLVFYVGALTDNPQFGELLASNVELLSGKSILEIESSTLWALSVTPTPVFVTWYLGVRGWYTSATAVAGGMLVYFVLTGDAGLPMTLLGMVGAGAALGFGDLDGREHSRGAVETVAVVLAVMVLAPLVVSVMPGSLGFPLGFGAGDTGQGAETLEASLLSADSQLQLQGAIELSPKVRFTVVSPERSYWRVDSYNRYTGDGWVRSGEPISYGGARLPAPPGEATRVTQVVRVESATSVMPAAWRPIAVDGIEDSTQVTTEYGLSPTRTLESGERYEVLSAVPTATPEDLTRAPTNDPADIEERYTQLPASTPDRVAERTGSVLGGIDNRYAAARRIEQYLEANKGYSLDVERPDGNVADAFLFEMDQGYCTYYATTMAVMLRTQGIPARVTVGYTPGQQVGDTEYVVRGYNSHAWVEVYFPGEGWMRFDPTPAAPRQNAQQQRLEEARANGTSGVDTDRSNEDTPTPEPTTPTPDPDDPTQTTPTTPTTPTPTTEPFGGVPTAETFDDDTEESGGWLPELPPTDQLVLGLIALVGTAAGVRRSNVTDRMYRWVWLRYLPRREPRTDIEGAYRRLEYVLERRHRPRRSGETVREYVESVGAESAARELARLYERSRYGNDATESMADEARELLGRVRGS